MKISILFFSFLSEHYGRFKWLISEIEKDGGEIGGQKDWSELFFSLFLNYKQFNFALDKMKRW